MKHDDHREPLLPPEEEKLLRAALHDAVADVVPRDGLAEVRRRTRQGRSASGSRRWMPVLVGAGAVAATVVVATVAVNGMSDDTDPGPATSPSSERSEAFDPAELVGQAAATYFISDSPTGARLYREFQPVAAADPEQALVDAVRMLAVDEGPLDPDYRTVWPAGSFDDVRAQRDRIVVELGTADALEAPVGITPEEQLLAVQQVVYTAEAAVGETVPVTFEWQGEPTTRVLGTDVPQRVERDTRWSVTAPVNISYPSEGDEVEGTLVATGSMSAQVPDASDVRWTVGTGGDEQLVLREGTAELADDPAPFAPGWRTDEIDLDGLEPGDYTLTVSVEEVGQASDVPAVFTDTRTFTVR